MGRDRVRRILRELEQAGYLIRTQSKTRDGRWTWRIELTDEPPVLPHRCSPIDGSAVDGSPARGPAADGSGAHLHKTLNSEIPDQIITTTTPEGIAASNTGTSSVSDIRYPLCLQGAHLPTARRMIEACPLDQRHAVLDEIGAMHTLGKVRRPLGLLRALAIEAARGQFFANHSVSNAQKPTAQHRRDSRVSHSMTGTQSTFRSPSPVSETGRETLARLRKNSMPKTSEMIGIGQNSSRSVESLARRAFARSTDIYVAGIWTRAATNFVLTHPIRATGFSHMLTDRSACFPQLAALIATWLEQQTWHACGRHGKCAGPWTPPRGLNIHAESAEQD